MTLRIKVRGIVAEFKEAVKQVESIEAKALIEEAADAVEALRVATPKDTEEAANSWRASLNGTKGVISNDAPHIGVLNAGSSKQARALFIERTLLSRGLVPEGTIIDRPFITNTAQMLP